MNIHIMWFMVVALAIGFLAPATLMAEVATPPPDVIGLLQSIQNNNWPVVVSAGLTLLIWVLRNLVRDRTPNEYLPIITLAIAILSSVSMRVSQQLAIDHIWWHGAVQGLVEGITVGLCAMGVWSAGAKRILPVRKVKKEGE